jgi:glycosyltransferase involved in cell wall biosynthesis
MLFESGSPPAIAGAIEEAAARRDMTEMGREARRRVEENWSIRKIADIHEEIFEKVLEDNRNA